MTVGRLNGTVDWTPGATGSLTADFVISDGSESITWRLFITVLPGNRAPKFQTAPVTTAFAGVPYVYNANATDADRDAVTYALVRGPDGMALDNSTGSLSWVPVAPGNCLVVLSASDGNGSEVFQEFTIIVSERVGPKVQITDPARNQTIKGRVSVTGKAFPGTLEVVKVQVRVDGGDWNDAEGDTGWTYSLDTTKLKNGKHVIEARAYDGMDHSDVASRAVTVDNAKSGGTGFIPGFGTVPLLVAAAALLVLRRKM
jgi:hypothetical protein